MPLASPTTQLLPLADLEDAVLRARVQHVLDNKTKPAGALGHLEALALQLALIQGSETPRLAQPQMLVCAADHGLAADSGAAHRDAGRQAVPRPRRKLA